jgi:hypothetical protein
VREKWNKMKKIDKKLVDELIRVVLKYYLSRGERDTLIEYFDFQKKLKEAFYFESRLLGLIEELAKYTLWFNKPHQLIYDTLKLWGYKVVDNKMKTNIESETKQ